MSFLISCVSSCGMKKKKKIEIKNNGGIIQTRTQTIDMMLQPGRVPKPPEERTLIRKLAFPVFLLETVFAELLFRTGRSNYQNTTLEIVTDAMNAIWKEEGTEWDAGGGALLTQLMVANRQLDRVFVGRHLFWDWLADLERCDPSLFHLVVRKSWERERASGQTLGV